MLSTSVALRRTSVTTHSHGSYPWRIREALGTKVLQQRNLSDSLCCTPAGRRSIGPTTLTLKPGSSPTTATTASLDETSTTPHGMEICCCETPLRLRMAPLPSAPRCRRSSFSRGQRRAAPCGSEACSPQELKRSSADDDLNAVWRSKHGLRFQNYRAKFCVLNAPEVPRQWIDDLAAGLPPVESHHCPDTWREWVNGRVYDVLAAPSTAIIRNAAEQTPRDQLGRAMLAAIHAHFQDRPTDFEKCAVDIWRLIAPATGTVDVTRPSRDGGRDAVGEYVLGPAADPMKIDFALEAKCYAATTVVGVRDVSRLVSRLRHRNFGVFVTLSHFNAQVYDEVRQDRSSHRTRVWTRRRRCAARKGYGDVAAVTAWLEASFPVTT